MATIASPLETGAYPFQQASRLLHISPQKLHRWLEPENSILNRGTPNPPEVLTFLELMELHVVKMFHDAGVSLQTIRKAAKTASKQFNTNSPFAVKRFDTNGTRIFATLKKQEHDQQIVDELTKGLLVFEQIVRPFFRKIEYRDHHEALRYWPREKSGRVVLDPAIRFGDPTDAETGIPTSAFFEAFKAEGDMATVAKWFEVPIAAVESAIAFEESLLD